MLIRKLGSTLKPGSVTASSFLGLCRQWMRTVLDSHLHYYGLQQRLNWTETEYFFLYFKFWQFRSSIQL